MRRFLHIGVLLPLLTIPPQPPLSAGQAAPTLRGFSTARAAAEREWEQKFAQLPSATRAEATLRHLTAEPHLAGTEASHHVAEYIRDEFRAAGLDAEIVSYRVLLSYPAKILLERVAPGTKRLARPEQPVEGDPSTADSRAIPGFNAYSPSADVTAPVVYANYGLPDDYRRLDDLGVSVKGKIVLVRYGQGFRGVKTRVAEERGAAAVLIYSDPAEDGYVEGDPYPKGPWRPESGIQRGSIQYTFVYPGDPLTPGVAATEDAKRIEISRAANLPRVATLPISWGDAAELLPHLGGPKVPREWQGGLPFTYHVGPGPAEAHLKLSMRLEMRTIYDVIGRLRGDTDDWVLAGNHHDAWIFGAADPSSGTTVLLELARSLGELKRAGWTPRRTILFCAWDAEEYGLLGSTEWVEQHMADLQQKAVAYLNMDTAVTGPNFGGSATPSLRQLVRDVAQTVKDPQSGDSVYQDWQARLQRNRTQHQSARQLSSAERPVPMSDLGSGSDYTAFFHHAGIPSLDISSGGDYGVYHSLYDDFLWMKRFGDPAFAYHVMMTRIAGTILLRLAGADVPPFEFSEYAAEIERHLRDLETVVRNAAPAPPLDLRGVEQAAEEFRDVASRADEAISVFSSTLPDAARAQALARALVGVESALLAPGGLAGRPWYRHTFSAPGTYTGYAAIVFPGVREAVDRRDWATARQEADALQAALERAAARLREAARLATTPQK
jgi:N-acetylated-alpha-linked acidic dipeptidase